MKKKQFEYIDLGNSIIIYESFGPLVILRLIATKLLFINY